MAPKMALFKLHMERQLFDALTEEAYARGFSRAELIRSFCREALKSPSYPRKNGAAACEATPT